MKILLTGATGAVGRCLAPALEDAGHEVFAATRRPEAYEGPGTAVELDLDAEPDDERWSTLAEVDAAYYLVHGLDARGYSETDRRRAERFVAHWGTDRRVVYLGGLGEPGEGSEHLRSRHEVGRILREGTDAVELRASLVIGPESLSFQLLARLGRLAGGRVLPRVVPVPKEARTKTQPIAQSDLTRLLVQGLDLPAGSYDIGGPDVVSFAELIERSARAQGRRLQALAVVPLDGEWIGPAAGLVSDTDPISASALFGSMGDETIVRDGHEPPGVEQAATGLDEALAQALA